MSARSPLSWNLLEPSAIEQEQHALLSEAIALNQNRILVRLRSRHATLQCNFKKDKVHRPKVIPQLSEAINCQSLAQRSGVPSLSFEALAADVRRLHRLFERLENLTTAKARSGPGLEILTQVVVVCQHVHDQHILHQVLAGLSTLERSSRASIVMTVTKLSRYSAVSRFLLQAARRYPIFRRVRISTACFRAPTLPAAEPDSVTAGLIHSLLDGPKLGKLTSKFRGSSPSAIRDHIRQEATSAIPVHAEVQLLFHYEQNSCSPLPRIICSSKQACFLCDLFFKIHGRFTVPSTHGRLYEKWALPDAVKNIGNADGNMLTILRRFVSAIDNALLREIQSSSKTYPDPHESMILHSAVCSQSNKSATSVRDSSASQKSTWNEGSISASNNHSRLQSRSPRLYVEKPAIANSIESGDVAPRSPSEASFAAANRAPSSLKALTIDAISSEEILSSTSLHVFLAKGQLIWRQLSSISHSFEVRTPCIHLTLSQGGPSCDLWSRRTSDDLDTGSGHRWVIIEYLSDCSVQQGEDIPLVNLDDVPSEHEMTLDYGSAEGPRKLRVCSNDDIISITYSSRKPVERLEYKL